MSRLVKILLCVCVCSAMAYSVPLFTENWDGTGGVINAGTWTVSEVADLGNIVLRDQEGDNDYALAIVGQRGSGNPVPHWGDWIYSVATINRVENLAITYKVWQGVSEGWPNYPDQYSFHGGWHNTNSTVYSSMEAAVGYVWSAITAAGGENGAHGLTDAHYLSGMQAAIDASVSKATATTVRITLGGTSGALWEYSTDNGANWNLGFDSRNVVGASTNVANYIGFGAFDQQWGTAMIDDISVEVIPEPCTLALLGIGGVAALIRRKRS